MFCPFNRLVIKQAEMEKQTPGGIIIPDKTRERYSPRRGTVIETGPECKYIQNNDEVVFKQPAGNAEVYVDGIPDEDGKIVEFIFANETDILAVTNRSIKVEPSLHLHKE